MGFTQALTARVSRKVTPTLQRIELSAADLAPFMPTEEGEPLPMVVGGPQTTSGPSGLSPEERQAIYKAIFDLKQEVDALKARVDRRELPPPSQPPLQEAEWQGQEAAAPERHYVDIGQEEQGPEEQHGLSWKQTEDELIRRALEKHHGNRKLAAEELGMSERTLYRKLPPEYRKK